MSYLGDVFAARTAVNKYDFATAKEIDGVTLSGLMLL
jgi:hypothetical protein